jgi:predicted aspartyl protease
MLDTGASMTVISLELAQKTGQEDLNKTERRSFSTAKGLLSCPIVGREIIIGSLDRKQSVAVNLEDNSNLLGVDFFESKGYIIDAASKSIYVWSK